MTAAKNQHLNFIAAVFAMALCLTFFAAGCGGEEESGAGDAAPAAGGSAGEPFEPGPFREAVFSRESAVGDDEAMIDVSRAAEGYFGVYSNSDTRLKLQVLKGDQTFTYDLTAGKTDFFPFQAGDGDYTVRVMKNLEAEKYFELCSATVSVTLNSEFEPFLHPGQYADYQSDSQCVALASSLAAEAADESGFIGAVYDYVSANVKYDYDKASTVRSGYIPVPDETLATGKGICFDYASLAASMLRSQGVPTKIIFGYVAPDGLYHAWNMFYSENEGWVTAEFKTDPKNWNRLDLTFTANGANGDFIGDGTNYTDVYQY